MKEVIYCLLLTVFLFLSTNCNRDYTYEYTTEFSDIFILTDSTILQFTSQSVISSILNIFYWEGQMCVHQSDELLFFDLNGNFIKKLSAEGSGPGEYKEITWVDFNSENELVLYDLYLNRVTVYDSLLNYLRLYSLGEEIKNYQMFIQTFDQKYYFYNTDLFKNQFTVDEYNHLLEYQNSFCLFPYNSVVQLRLSGNRNLAYIPENNKLLVSHIYDPILKLIDLSVPQKTDSILLSPNFWKPIEEKTVRALFPNIGVHPRNLFNYLEDKTKIWKIYYLKRNLCLIEYWLPKGKFWLQIIDMKEKTTLFTVKVPKFLGEVVSVEGENIYFAKYTYDKGDQNPTIFKFKSKFSN
jgi:hypothetical protein